VFSIIGRHRSDSNITVSFLSPRFNDEIGHESTKKIPAKLNPGQGVFMCLPSQFSFMCMIECNIYCGIDDVGAGQDVDISTTTNGKARKASGVFIRCVLVPDFNSRSGDLAGFVLWTES